MKNKKLVSVIMLLIFVLGSFGAMFAADRLQHDNGNIEVTEGAISIYEGENEPLFGTITYKLYTPAGATADNKAPAVLLLHGYQNDHETCAAYCIELSRRGAIVMAIDEYGHGKTDIGLLERGYVNHKVTVNYGEDSKEAGTYVEGVGGAERYRIMMNFSNLSFFNDYYSKDD